MPLKTEIVYEGDKCPDCGEGYIEAKFVPYFRLVCPKCGAEWDERGKKVKDGRR